MEKCNCPGKVTVKNIPFRRLFSEPHYFEEMQRIYDSLPAADEKIIPRRISSLDVLEPGMGNVFFAYCDDYVVGFMTCFIGRPDKYSSALRDHLKHDLWFAEELMSIGRFVFQDQIIIHQDFQKKGVGSEILSEMEKYYKSQHIVLIGGVIPEQNIPTHQFFKKADYHFIDHFVEESSHKYWCRIIKIFNKNSFSRQINSHTLPEAFKTLIPLQLNMATQNVNALIHRMGAEVTWSAFFHKDDHISRYFGIPQIYMGYYAPILEARSKAAFDDTLATLKMLSSYFKKLPTEAKAASLTEGMRKKGFEFFIIDQKVEDQDFESTFINPVVFNIRELNIREIKNNYHLSVGRPLSNSERIELRRVLNTISNQKSKPVSAGIKSLWVKWKDLLSITGEEENLLIQFFKDKNQGRTTDRSKLLLEIEQRRLLSEEQKRIWEEWLLIHRMLWKTDIKNQEEQVNWCHAVVPITFSGGPTRIMFSFIVKNNPTDPTLIADLAYIISNTLAKNMFNVMLKLKNSMLKSQQVKQAVSKVQIRNLAHNMGSHILAHLSNPRHLDRFFYDHSQPINIEELAKFFAYLQTRMDFLADLATSDPVVAVSRRLNQELIANFNQEKIIRTFVSGTSLRCKELKFENRVRGKKDLLVQIPNGDLGNHAFYNILENIIRNSAKHEAGAGVSEILLQIKCEAPSNFPRHYKITIYDNIPRQHDSTLAENDRLVNKINSRFINRYFLDNDNEIRQDGWGIMEMQIAAAYLRKIPTQLIDDDGRALPLLKAVEVYGGKNKKNYFLGYEIYLKKPRELLIMDCEDMLMINNKQNLQKYGIRILGKNDIHDKDKNIYSHSMAAVIGDYPDNNITRSKIFPLRKIYIRSGKELISFEKKLNENPEKLIAKCYNKWIAELQVKKQIKDTTLTVKMDGGAPLDLPLSTISNSILFDHHFMSYAHDKFHPDALFYYEGFSTPSPTGMLLSHLHKESRNVRNRIFLELKEAALTRVIVLDERIQKEVMNKQTPDLPMENTYLDELRWANIFIPHTDEINLYDDNTYSRKETITLWLENKLSTLSPDFCVIHIGILEKIVGSSPEQLLEYFIRLQKINSKSHIVLITGRGKPHYIPEGTLFLHFSNIAKYILQEKSKYHLTKVLFSARTRKPNDV
ncbi:MAG: GNAT family N-acetyltransferase [Bacteroidia bacterium]